jgi:hypothetical protein
MLNTLFSNTLSKQLSNTIHNINCTTWSTVILNRLTVTHWLRNLPLFRNKKVHVRVYKSSLLVLNLSQIKLVHTFTLYSYHLGLDLPNGRLHILDEIEEINFGLKWLRVWTIDSHKHADVSRRTDQCLKKPKRENLMANTERNMGAQQGTAMSRTVQARGVKRQTKFVWHRIRLNAAVLWTRQWAMNVVKRRGMASYGAVCMYFSRTPFYEDSLKRIEKPWRISGEHGAKRTAQPSDEMNRAKWKVRVTYWVTTGSVHPYLLRLAPLIPNPAITWMCLHLQVPAALSLGTEPQLPI